MSFDPHSRRFRCGPTGQDISRDRHHSLGRRRTIFNLVLWSFVLALTPSTLGLAWKRFSDVGEWSKGILSPAIVGVRQWRSPHSRGIDASEVPARWPAEGRGGTVLSNGPSGA